jgi:hypothetical protein
MPVIRQKGDERSKQLENFMNILWLSGIDYSKDDRVQRFVTLEDEIDASATRKHQGKETTMENSNFSRSKHIKVDRLPLDVDLEATTGNLKTMSNHVETALQILQSLLKQRHSEIRSLGTLPFEFLASKLRVTPLAYEAAIDDCELLRDFLIASKALMRRVQDACFDDKPLLDRQQAALQSKLSNAFLSDDMRTRYLNQLGELKAQRERTKKLARQAKIGVVKSMAISDALIQRILFTA